MIYIACAASRIGEISGVRVMDIDTENRIWHLVRQTTPARGGLLDKDPKNKRDRYIPIMQEIRPMARVFTGPRGGRISAVLWDATHWNEVVVRLGYEHLRRHDLRRTGLTLMADAGIQVHVLRRITGRGSLSTTQHHLHSDYRKIPAAGNTLNHFLTGLWSPDGPKNSTL